MRTEPRRSTLRWASGYVVTSERAGNALLVMATIALIVAFCLPWWSLRAWVLPRVAAHLPHGFNRLRWLGVAELSRSPGCPRLDDEAHGRQGDMARQTDAGVGHCGGGSS